ncbi:mariner Mos1 transposase [Trichonephila clavipes]|uniref:Mariner Mos1 transposase n=1 Tax=Trichonephila clavipes TaxID=2585209 RepID=A0A8X6RF55_TRICX|nr:mariner Mos1 transposase [Trichonephila clavipes]
MLTRAVSRCLKAMGEIIKVGRWVPHQLTDRQQENRKIVSEILLSRYKCKSYLHRIVTGNEKWIYFKNPKCNRTAVQINCKTMLCIFWDQEGSIYYELLTHGKTVITDHYKQQLLNLNNAILEKLEQYKKRQHKVIFLDNNAPSHCA